MPESGLGPQKPFSRIRWEISTRAVSLLLVLSTLNFNPIGCVAPYSTVVRMWFSRLMPECAQVNRRTESNLHATCPHNQARQLQSPDMHVGSVRSTYRSSSGCRASSSRFGGARHTRESLAIKRQTNWQRFQRKSQTPAGWNG